MSSSKALLSEQFHLPLSHKTSIGDLLCLMNNQIFIYFNSGRYQHWNLKSENEGAALLHEGKIDVNLYNLQALSDTRIFYVNLNKKCFEVFDLEHYTVLSHFNSSLPTSIAFSPADRSSTGEEIMKFDSDIVIFRDSQTIVVFEQNKKGSDQKFGVTIFNEESCLNKAFVQQYLLFGILNGNNKLYFSKLNEIDTVALFYQCNDKDIPKIWLLNISNKQVIVVSLSSALHGMILDVKAWGPNRLSLWLNYDLSEKVKIAIINYEEGEVIIKEGNGLVELKCKSHELLSIDEGTDKSHLLMDVMDVDYSQGIVMLYMDSQNAKNRIFLYDTQTLKECYKKTDNSEDEGAFSCSISIDKKYFVEFPKDEGGEEKETEGSSNHHIVYSRIIPFKILTADLMEKTGIFQRFGQYSGKEILDASSE